MSFEWISYIAQPQGRFASCFLLLFLRQECKYHIDEIFATGCNRAIKMTTSDAASDENVAKTVAFPLQCFSGG